jgi:UDP-2-acetamido-3-amino-2,3-dideoxy-glucuronate N-acetyltransferase
MNSVVAETATIGENTTFGHFCVISENVSIGQKCRIGHHVIIYDDTVIGDECVIDDHAVVGKMPLSSRAMAFPPDQMLEPLRLFDGVVIGTSTILFRGSSVGANSLIADLASVRERSNIGENTIIGRCVAIENEVEVGSRCKIEAGAFICAWSQIGDDCFVAPEVTLTNDNFLGRTEARKQHFAGAKLERGARIGANATVLPGRTIEADGLAAAGSTVTRDVESKRIVVGIPARDIKAVPEEQTLPADSE